MTDQPSAPRRGHRMLAAAAGLGVLGLPLAAPAPSPSPSASPLPAPPTGPDRGTVLYQQSCASCHGQRGEGTQRGPSLADVGPASVDFQLSTGRMPLSKEGKPNVHQDAVFSESDIRALVQHVASFPPGGGPPIPVVGGGSTPSGRELYLTYCSACHSAAGVGATLNNGRIAPSLFEATPTQIGEAVRVGPGLMPAFPPDVLSDEEVDDVAAYVGVLQDDRGELDRGGWPLGRLGPFTEGVVAWVFGLTIVLLLARRLGSRAR
ncbi:c-type cytochrome [Pseudosporangium ferrugineum]|uniref:Ubiquinol-cytochrome c reductase cytochrome c subunit n=1 Tax=Pseudosporangium ferrugineum TaxID=439699 RepID=A0A2T0RGD2_9ACTN|nr:c-type cytochrome [Pseudosporangium ferrugineum]PRY20192.1 ubiquinol-cytochrome c reductase cytochrome c subunit [Pseudosporangium ferrugineum]